MAFADDFHRFMVEWTAGEIRWSIDGTEYRRLTPAGLPSGAAWVFNHPFFILMNVAVGGNFGGTVGEDTTFPQSMSVDYVRLYQSKPKPVTFRASFTDNFSGWQQISLPFSAFQNEDGLALDLTQVHAVRFIIPDGLTQPVLLDQLRVSCPNEVTVSSPADVDGGAERGGHRDSLGQ